MKQRARIFGAVLCVYIMLLCGYMLYLRQAEAKLGNNAYRTVQRTAGFEVVSSAPETASTADPALPSVDFGTLREINSEVVAWIYSPGTDINYPVVQGRDNQYYLNRLFDGSYNNNGCIFLDVRSAPDFSEKNSVIYGHHMKTEAMFSSIEGYKKQSYYEAHPAMYLITETAAYRVELFAGIVKDASDILLTFSEGNEFLAYTNWLKDSSTFSSDIEIAASDRLLTLSTCVYDFEDARYILVGKLVPITE